MYQLGGTSPLLNISRSNKTRIKIGAGLDWSLGGVCGFDPAAAFKNELEEGRQAIKNLGRDVLGSVQDLAVASFLSEVRDLNPGLYDTLMRGIVEARESINVAVKSCEQMNSDLLAGQSPADDWIKISTRGTWGRGAAAAKNPTQVRKKVLEQGGNEGLTWVAGESAGGVGQPPIEVVADTLGMGYRQWSDDDRQSTLVQTFPDVASAQKWTVSVVGEKIVRTCVECQKIETKIGQGLRTPYLAERDKAFESLTAVLADGQPTTTQLQALSVTAMGIQITHQVIDALRAEEMAEREILANRLAGEIALSRTLSKALVARNLLRAGLQEPNIQANGEALEELDRRLTALNEEIDNVLYEHRIRKELLTNTSQMILTRASQRNRDLAVGALDALDAPQRTPSMIDGAVPIDK